MLMLLFLLSFVFYVRNNKDLDTISKSEDQSIKAKSDNSDVKNSPEGTILSGDELNPEKDQKEEFNISDDKNKQKFENYNKEQESDEGREKILSIVLLKHDRDINVMIDTISKSKQKSRLTSYIGGLNTSSFELDNDNAMYDDGLIPDGNEQGSKQDGNNESYNQDNFAKYSGQSNPKTSTDLSPPNVKKNPTETDVQGTVDLSNSPILRNKTLSKDKDPEPETGLKIEQSNDTRGQSFVSNEGQQKTNNTPVVNKPQLNGDTSGEQQTPETLERTGDSTVTMPENGNKDPKEAVITNLKNGTKTNDEITNGLVANSQNGNESAGVLGQSNPRKEPTPNSDGNSKNTNMSESGTGSADIAEQSKPTNKIDSKGNSAGAAKISNTMAEKQQNGKKLNLPITSDTGKFPTGAAQQTGNGNSTTPENENQVPSAETLGKNTPAETEKEGLKDIKDAPKESKQIKPEDAN